jgi:uncharacterized SAM-binding protein YcdF (DUF218 family)
MLLKKLVSYLLLPFPLILLLLVIGTVLLWFTSRQRAGKILVSVGAFALLVFSFPATNQLLLSPLGQFRPFVASSSATAAIRWVVVLGSGYSTAAGAPATARVDSMGLERLVEGIRLVRSIPGSKLLVSGGSYLTGVPQAQVLADAAVALGVPRADIVLEATSFDTQDEARLVRDIVRDDRFLLVTSAIHMRRSMRLFEKQGMKPIAAPAGFWSDRRGLLPSSQNIVRADYADHEYLGMLWSLLRGTM